jgi:ribosomal protein L11 methyltransferase
MFSLRLQCPPSEADIVSAELWDLRTVAISEYEENGWTVLLAGFEDEGSRDFLLTRFADYAPVWLEDNTDWISATEKAWPPRAIGRNLFLAAPWCNDRTPPGRVRMIHNPGLASGTGEHPCTQLVLEALERCTFPGTKVLDVGTGSGILSIGALQLGAGLALGIDPDTEALQVARENFELNHLAPALAAGSADCIADGWADITIANISGTVLMSILDDLLRVTHCGGVLILSGFADNEVSAFLHIFPDAEQTTRGGWSCLTAKVH